MSRIVMLQRLFQMSRNMTYPDTVKITIARGDPNVLFGLYSGRNRHFYNVLL